jgi:hypothetical protein
VIDYSVFSQELKDQSWILGGALLRGLEIFTSSKPRCQPHTTVRSLERPMRQDFEFISNTIFCVPPKVRALKISKPINNAPHSRLLKDPMLHIIFKLFNKDLLKKQVFYYIIPVVFKVHFYYVGINGRIGEYFIYVLFIKSLE